MNRNRLKQYAPQARRDCIVAVTDRAAYYGLTSDTIAPSTEQGDVVVIAGKSFPRHIASKRKRLEERITRQGFEPTMETIAYTWFNRFAAIRFMELHGYLEHGYRVLSHPDPEKPTPEILEHAAQVELPGLHQSTVIDLKLDGTRDPELYRMLLMAQCNALHAAMPFLFERIDDETELLLPDNLLHSDSLIRKLVNGIDEADWQDVEIIGWLYQFYIAEKKDQAIGKVVKSEDIPAATQLFTPNWIVKYLVQNSLGRQWLATYPDSPLKQQMEYYIEPAEQTPDVQAQLKAITPESLHPEELTLLDPACGSGHILVEAYDLFKAIYQERGYRARDIPALILQKNLFGLEIDDRAAQLAAFALMMKARADDRRIFANGVQPHILAIQESKGLNAQQITEALNRPLDAGEIKGQQGNIAPADVAQLITLFEHGKTFGSLIRVSENVAENLPAIAERVQDVLAYGGMLEQAAARSAEPLVEQAHHLAQKYDCVVANPPYMGGKGMNAGLKEYARQSFPYSKSDLFAMFIERVQLFAAQHALVGLVTPYVWMFLGSYGDLRDKTLSETTLTTLIQLEYNAFEPACIPVCAFVFLHNHMDNYAGSYVKLSDFRGHENQAPKTLEAIRNPKCGWFYTARQSDFHSIPGQPIAYWIGDGVRNVFRSYERLGNIASPRAGLATGDNSQFQRAWTEVSCNRIGFELESCEQTYDPRHRWFPCNSGGTFRKWYGNNEIVVDWQNDGYAIKHFVDDRGKVRSRPQNTQFYFKPGVTWTKLSSSSFGARLREDGFVFDDTGRSAFPRKSSHIEPLLALLCSKSTNYFLSILNPTMSYTSGDIANIPISERILDRFDTHISSQAIAIARSDWDGHELSWSFKKLPWLEKPIAALTVETTWANWAGHCALHMRRMGEIEEINNRFFIEAYGLQDELSPEVADDQITLYRPNREEDIKRLLSYAIGCMMGRYSLDKPGLIYAHSSNQGFDPSQYPTFPADSDGIIPMMETDWFPDDASNRLVEFISVAWPKEHLAENLTFIADSLGPNRNEQPRETIRRYFATGFYKHHLQMYKRRPIYWLFSSGKQRAFQCLVYLHRYHEGTLARMRTEYVIPLQGKMASRLDQLADDIAAASSTPHRKKLEKERDTLRKQHTELQTFDEQLRHYADRRINLDLDDGVKVNYGKFGDLLADVKAVTGGSEES